MRWFVYELIDPRDGMVFYVGKGTGNRPARHAIQASTGNPSAKCQVIREIQDAGTQYNINIVKRFAKEADAYKFEQQHIASIGLHNLTNVLAGGECHWWKADPDKALAHQLAKFAAKTNGFRNNTYFWMLGQRIELGATFLKAKQAHTEALLQKHGSAWCQEIFSRHRVRIRQI